MEYDLEDLEKLMREEWESGGITIFCDCGYEDFVEPDAEGWCPYCQKKIKNPLIEARMI
jgi:hypothetical protein